MSGVGVSGLLANLPNTVTPYPVLDYSLGLGGIRTVNDNTARDAIPANFRQEGMLVYSKLTKAIYGLLADLSTWVIVTTLGLGTQAAWFVDATNGNDNNSGLSGSPLKTAEELSNRMSPGGASIRLQQLTTATFAAGSYGDLTVNVAWFKGAVAFTHEFIPQGTVTSSAPITLSAVVAAVPSTQTRGQITTLSGVFVAKSRIRVTSGARVGSLTYSTGLNANAQNTWVGPWLNYASGSTLPPAVNDTVVVDTLQTTLANVSINNTGTGNTHVRDMIISVGLRLDESPEAASSTGSNQFVDGCQMNANSFAGNVGGYLWSCAIVFAARCRQGNWKIDGCSVQGNLYAYPNTGVSLDDNGNVFDGGTLIIGGTSSSNRVGSAVCRVSGPTEFCNGIAGSAISVSAGSVVQTGQVMWSGTSAGTAYTTAIQVDANAAFQSSIGFAQTINATNALSIAGQLFATFPLAPIINYQYGSYAQNIQVLSTVNAQFTRTAQSANITSQNLFSATPIGGMYHLDLTVSCTTADAAATGAPVVTVSWVAESLIGQTASVTVPLTTTGTQSVSVAMPISHASNTNPTISVTGITSAGNARYEVEAVARRQVFSSQ